jgi:hypothetical protein
MGAHFNTSVHINDATVRVEIVERRRDASDFIEHGARRLVMTVGSPLDGLNVFIDNPQHAIELGRALLAAGQQAQRENDVEAATRAALDAVKVEP